MNVLEIFLSSASGFEKSFFGTIRALFVIILTLFVILSKLNDIIPQATAIAIREVIYKNHAMPGSIIELKAKKNASGEELRSLARAALEQIEDRQYGTDMKTNGIGNIIKYGVAFSGKHVEIVCKADF